jgi:lysozyme
MATSGLPEMIKRHEGLRLKPYRCPAGKLTIGVGWNIDANPLPPDIRDHLKKHGAITGEMAERLLTISIGRAAHACRVLYPDFSMFLPKRQDALIDLMFNMGPGTLKRFVTTNQAINQGRWEDAANGLQASKWFTQVGARGPEIVDMIRTGD